MINGTLQEFVGDVVNRRRINFGDVRRLQRVFLPSGITNREEMEVLVSLNTKLVRADKAWAQWLVAAVEDFVVTQEECRGPAEDGAHQSTEHLLTAPATGVDRRIARQIRRALAKPRDAQPKGANNDSLEGARRKKRRSRVGPHARATRACSIRNDMRVTHRTVVRPTEWSFGLIAPGIAIGQFPAWSAADRYQPGRFSTGHGASAVLARPCMA